jgi:hypothetical protein
MLNGWTDGCMRFMPREWVEAQGFVWADAILATALLALAALSYVMLAHMLRSWGDAQQNASTTGARASPTDGGHEPASAAGSGRSASCAEYGPVEGEIEGMTALMRASSQGDEACALELIAAGAQIDARDSQEGFTALLMASAMGAPAPARPHSPCAALACLARDRVGAGALRSWSCRGLHALRLRLHALRLRLHALRHGELELPRRPRPHAD